MQKSSSDALLTFVFVENLDDAIVLVALEHEHCGCLFSPILNDLVVQGGSERVAEYLDIVQHNFAVISAASTMLTHAARI